MTDIKHSEYVKWLAESQHVERHPTQPTQMDTGISSIIVGRGSIGGLVPEPTPTGYPMDIPRPAELDKKVSELNQTVNRIVEDRVVIARINNLKEKRLSCPLDVIVEPDGQGFLARTPDLPLYGYGDDRIEAIDMLKREIESLYEDLIRDDDFSGEYLRIKKYLSEIIT